MRKHGKDKIMKKKYSCSIDCAACAAKAEDAIRKIDGVHDARINFVMQKFTLDAEDDRYDEILKAAVRAGKKVEPEFNVDIG